MCVCVYAYIWTSLELCTCVTKWGFWVFLLLFPKIPFSTWEHTLGFPPPTSPCISKRGGGEALQTEHPTDTLDPPTQWWVCDSDPALVLQDFLSFCLPSLSWFTREEHLAVPGSSNCLSPKLKASPQPSSHWNWVTFTGAPGDSEFSDCQVFCVDSRFHEAWQLSISFGSLSDASTHLLGLGLSCLYQWGLWLLLQTEDLYLILSRGKLGKMLTAGEGILYDFASTNDKHSNVRLKMHQLILLPIYSKCDIKFPEVPS